MTNSGDAAETVVRVMLTGTEIPLRLTASATKNLLALSVALAKQHKQISGKTNMKRMLKDTRDIRVFPMTKAQYRAFQKQAKLRCSTLPFGTRMVDRLTWCCLPRSWIGRIWSLKRCSIGKRIKYQTRSQYETARQKRNTSKKRVSVAARLDCYKSAPERSKATPGQRTTSNERESVMLRLEQYRKQLNGRATKTKERNEREK